MSHESVDCDGSPTLPDDVGQIQVPESVRDFEVAHPVTPKSGPFQRSADTNLLGGITNPS